MPLESRGSSHRLHTIDGVGLLGPAVTARFRGGLFNDSDRVVVESTARKSRRFSKLPKWVGLGRPMNRLISSRRSSEIQRDGEVNYDVEQIPLLCVS